MIVRAQGADSRRDTYNEGSAVLRRGLGSGMKLGAIGVPPTLSVPRATATLPGSVVDPGALLLRAVDAAELPLADARSVATATGVGDFQRAVLDTAALAAPAVPPGSAPRPTTANLLTATLVIATSAPLPPPAPALVPVDAAPLPADEPVAAARHNEEGRRDDAPADPIPADHAPPEAIMPLDGAYIVSTTVAGSVVAVAISPRVPDPGAFDRSDPDANPASPAVQSIAAPVAPSPAPPDGSLQLAAAAVGDAATGAGLLPAAVAQSSPARPAERGGEPPPIAAPPPRLPDSEIAAAETRALPASPEPRPADAPKPSMAAVPSPVDLPPITHAAVQPKPPTDAPQPPMAVAPSPVDLPPGRHGAAMPIPPAVVAETGTIAVAKSSPVAAAGTSQPVARSKPVVAAPGDSAVFAPVAAAAVSFAAAPPAVVPVVHITVQPQQLARDVGRAMVRQLSAAGNELHIRLDPAQLGRIDVRLTFDELGTLRAVVGAETSQVLDLLRRDSAGLGRAMADAGVRSDNQSFRFEDRGGDQRQDRPQPQRPRGARNEDLPDTPAADRFQPLRWRGQINVIA